jgi:hypothetical protein
MNFINKMKKMKTLTSKYLTLIVNSHKKMKKTKSFSSKLRRLTHELQVKVNKNYKKTIIYITFKLIHLPSIKAT